MSFLAEYEERLTRPSDVQYCMPWMREAALRYPKVYVLELGVRSGNSTSAWLSAAEENGGHVWSMDTEPPAVPAHWHQSPLWTFVQGDDLSADIWLEQFTFDIVFIDTIHTYAHTLAELGRYVPQVRPGGSMFLHDSLLRDVDGEPAAYPVATALGEYCGERGLDWTEHGGQFGFAEISRPNG